MPQEPWLPTVWWYMNTTTPTTEKRHEKRRYPDTSKDIPMKFFGTWNEFSAVLAGNATGQGIKKNFYK